MNINRWHFSQVLVDCMTKTFLGNNEQSFVKDFDTIQNILLSALVTYDNPGKIEVKNIAKRFNLYEAV